MAWINRRSLAISTAIPLIVYLVIFFLGGLRRFEYNLYDFYLGLRPNEPIDSRIVIVGITEEDLEKLDLDRLDDGTLVKVLQKIKANSPRVIGLDLHRNIPVCLAADSCKSDSHKLASLFRDTPNLIGIEKTTAGNPKEKPILPHPELAKAKRTGDSALIEDSDRIVRRSYFYLTLEDGESFLDSLGATLALKYLAQEDINLIIEGRNLSLNQAVFKEISPQFKFYKFEIGGYFYPAKDIGGYQILLNYRQNKHPFKQISISQILEDNFNEEDLRDKIVLLGATYELSKDIYSVPHFQPGEDFDDFSFGVEIHAQLASYLVNAALENRTVFKFLPGLVNNSLIILLLLEPLLLIYWLDKKRQKALNLLLLAGGQIAVIFAGSWLSLSLGYWLPGANFIFITALITVNLSLLVYQHRHEQEKLILEEEVRAKTQELEQALADLRKITREVVDQEKASFFLESTAFLDHEIKNPLGLILIFSETAEAQTYSLVEELEQDNLSEHIQDMKETIAEIIMNNVAVAQQVQRIKNLLELIDTTSYQKQEDLASKNIRGLIEQEIELALHTFNKKMDSELSVEILQDIAEIGEINVYPINLHIALSNLLRNSLHSLFSKKKKQDFQPQIEIKSRKESEYLVITIEDNGEGIDSQNYQKIFQPFYSTKEKSLGFGLFITKQIIEEQHQGSIEVESKLGSFTRFKIKIPTNLFDESNSTAN